MSQGFAGLGYNGRVTVARAATWVRSGAAIETPVNAVPYYVPKDGTIIGVVLLTQDSGGTCTVDIKKAAFASYPPSSSICGGNKPAISGGNTTFRDLTLTGWTTAVAAGDVLQFSLDATTTFKAIFVFIIILEAAG